MIKRKGFTLIELLVVIGIIALLSTLAVVALNNARLKARDAKRVADIKQMATALELYYQDQNGYPGTAVVTAGSANAKCLSSSSAWAATCAGVTYMGNVPSYTTPPTGNYVYSPLVGTAACTGTQTCDNYQMTFTLEGLTGNLSAGGHTASPTGIN